MASSKADRITPAGGATRFNNLNASSPRITSISAPSVAFQTAVATENVARGDVVRSLCW
jgi:hypothetical protein